MKLTAKKLVSLAFAAAVASAISGMPLEASADPPDQSQPKIIVTENGDTTFECVVTGQPTISPGVEHHVKVSLVNVNSYKTARSTLPTMTAVNTVTGESYAFEDVSARTAQGRFYYAMACNIPGTEELNILINVDVTKADGHRIPDCWHLAASAATVPSRNRNPYYTDWSNKDPYRSGTARLGEQHHNVTVAAKTLTRNSLQLQFIGRPEPQNQGSYHNIYATVYTYSRSIVAGDTMPGLRVEDLITGDVWENNPIIGDGGIENPLNTPTTVNGDGLNFVLAKHRQGATRRYDLYYEVDETQDLNVTLTVCVENATQPETWSVEAITGAAYGTEHWTDTTITLPNQRIIWQGTEDRYRRGISTYYWPR
jgi:hypothetical protein